MAMWARVATPYRGQFDPTDRFVTSWLFTPGILFACRALLSLYAFTTLFFIFGWNGEHGGAEASRRSFSYFTVLTYWGLAFWYAFSAFHTGSYWLKGTSVLARWPRSLQVAHSMFYSTIVTYPFIVTIVYWAILSPGRFPSTFLLWSNTSQHALNSVYALFEVIFPRTSPLPWIDIIPVIGLLALYLGLAYLTHATKGFYVYGFLDLQKNTSGIVAAYIVGILAAAIIFFIVVRYLIMLRIWVTESRLGRLGKFSRRGNQAVTTGELEKGVSLNKVSAA